MRICVFGAGAVGGQLAVRLWRGGSDVSVVARGAHLDAIRRVGLSVRSPAGIVTAPLRASDDPADLGAQDAVIVVVKAYDIAAVATTIAPLLGPHTPVAFVANGIPWWYFHGHGGAEEGRRLPRLDPDDIVRERIGPARVIGGVSRTMGDLVAPGVIASDLDRVGLVLGEPDGSATPRLKALSEALAAGGVAVETTGEIRRALWEKLVGNLASGPISVLTLGRAKDHYGGGPLTEAARRLHGEALSIASAMGFTIESGIERLMERGRGSHHVASIAQDMARGRPIELDAQFLQPLDFARERGVAAPTLELLAAMAVLRAERRGAMSAIHGARPVSRE